MYDRVGMKMTGAGERRRRVARALRYVWAFPNTLVGLSFLPLVLFTGGRVQLIDGVLELHGRLVSTVLRHCVPLRGGASAITFGHVVLGCDARTLAATRDHERVHVRQCEVWGPAFIPAYLLAGVGSLLAGSGAYDGNYFERQACCEAEIASRNASSRSVIPNP